MERFVLLVVTLLCTYVTCSYAEENKEMTHKESQPNDVPCPGGRHFCRTGQKCCPKSLDPGQWVCCRLGPRAVCCSGYPGCCRPGTECDIVRRRCVRSSLPVNNTDKLGRDGTAATYPKVTRMIPQQLERSLKRIGFRDTSGGILFPDEKYQCPDGTSRCELFYGIYGCCPIQNKREIKITEARGRRP